MPAKRGNNRTGLTSNPGKAKKMTKKIWMQNEEKNIKNLMASIEKDSDSYLLLGIEIVLKDMLNRILEKHTGIKYPKLDIPEFMVSEMYFAMKNEARKRGLKYF